jgi:glycosyltransferase involved in cell wall biosynthesis
MNERPPPRPAGPIAYLTGEYPRVSHTFILREIQALRMQGIEVLPCTVRRPPPEAVVGEDQEAEARRTFGVIERARAPHRLAAAHLAILARAPRRWFAALGLAWRTRPAGLKATLWQFFYFLEAAVLARYLTRRGAVHLHNHFGNSSCSVAMLASLMADIPFSFTEHGPAIFFEAGRWRLDEKTARARFVVAISHFCRSQLMLFSDPAHWEKIAIVHCGIDPGAYGRAARGAFGQRVLFVGRLDPVKGAALLLDAFAAARGRHPEARLEIVGDGPERPALETRARALGLGRSLRFLGYLSQDAVARKLEEVDILVLPSFAEGVPVVLMEAMASRIPVIASRVAGVPELVEDGVSGFLVPPGDVAGLTERLQRLLGDPDLCARMGAAGRAKVAAEFAVAAEAGKLAELFAGAAPTARAWPLHGGAGGPDQRPPPAARIEAGA